ncbi:MAG: trypsin-like peptidase domain-containing protein [Prevotellaceae bacterium]|jgi:hypothetical protein|nr:trypsin-like peptidase domain-containing protein [Prevotellaceae bacterium]
MRKLIFVSALFLVVSATNAQITTNEKPYGLLAKQGKNFIRGNAAIQTEIKTFSAEYKAFTAQEDSINGLESDYMRYAFAVPVNYTLQNSGTWQNLTDGGKIWRLKVSMPNALSTNAYYSKFWLPDGAKFFVYNEETGQSIGAITSEFIGGNKQNPAKFATANIHGENVIFEYYQPANVNETAIIEIFRIDYGYRYLSTQNDGLFGTSLPCQININCSDAADWQIEKHAIARISVMGEGGTYFGTCVLVNNTKNDFTPYVLTANHFVGHTGKNAWNDDSGIYCVTYWNYELPNCNNDTINPLSYTTIGAEIVANEESIISGNDFALLKLIQNPLDNYHITPYYLGWDRSGSDVDSAVAIHHPQGDVKKISFSNHIENYDTIFPYQSNSGEIYYGYYSMYRAFFQKGTIEQGSSGSPLINNERKMVGIVVIGPKYPFCDETDMFQYNKIKDCWYAENDYYMLKPWLAPIDTSTVTLNGIWGIHSDLYIRDNINDNGNTPTTGAFIASPDIEIVDMNGSPVLEPKIYKDYKVKITVHNNSSTRSIRTDKLHVYWVKTGVEENFPGYWNDKEYGAQHLCADGEELTLGGTLALWGITIPAGISAGGDTTIYVNWNASDRPILKNYVNCLNEITESNNNEEHIGDYTLLAVIGDGEIFSRVSEDPTAYNLSNFVLESKRAACKNVTFVLPPDLYVQDNIADTGDEPNTTTTVHNNSPAIKIMDDYGREVNVIGNIDPRFGYNIKVKVKNNSIDTVYLNNVSASLLLVKAGINDIWNNWLKNPAGNFCIDNGNHINLIFTNIQTSTLNRNLSSGEEGFFTFERPTTPDFYKYQNCVDSINIQNPSANESIWHYNLICVINDGLPVKNLESGDVDLKDFVLNSNNVAMTSINYAHTDLYIKDNTADSGIERNTSATEHYRSPDIKIVDWNTLQEVSTSALDPNKDYKIKVIIRNKESNFANGTERLRVYWAKAGINESWPNQWNGTPFTCGNNSPVIIGGLLNKNINNGYVTIPTDQVVKINNGLPAEVLVDWKASDRPRFNQYQECVDWINDINSGDDYEENIWHYCLLAVLEDGNTIPDLNTTTNGSLRNFVLNSNNVASVNVAFMQVAQNTSLMSIMQPAFIKETFDLKVNFNNNLLQYAEVYVKPDKYLQQAWENSGSNGTGFKITKKGWLLTSNEVVISNIKLPEKELHTLHTSVYFLSKEIPETDIFEFDITTEYNGELLGGEHYIVARDLSRYFAIQAHANAILTEKTLKLTADEINEPAKYIWYNSEEKEIGNGKEIEIDLPKKSSWYKLEVIATADKYKDYDSVYVNIPNGFIVSLTPNPAQDNVKIAYFLSDAAQTATIQIYNTLGNLVKQENLNISEKEKNISLNGLLQGNYSVVLVTNNSPSDFKNLIKQ